jgi:NADPH:quinone reductase-like Zn-dependent oxidoreductase
MKAIVYREYGSTDVLKLEEVEKPAPGNDEVLVKVHAASVNDFDWGLLRGSPFINRVIGGIRKPKHNILGCDIAGRIEAVGKDAKQLKIGDEVLGDLSGCGFGGYAEYVCAPEKALTVKPKALTFEQAAAVPHAATLVLQSLRDRRMIGSGDKVLFNGAGGGAGTLAVQIVKDLGAEITAVDSADKLEMLTALGADHVIDYRAQDFTRNGQRYDLIIDVQTRRGVFAYRRALNRGGLTMMVGGSLRRVFSNMFISPLFSMFGKKKIVVLAHSPNKHMDYMNELLESGKVTPVIDKTFPLSEVPEALNYFGSSGHTGKIIVAIGE